MPTRSHCSAADTALNIILRYGCNNIVASHFRFLVFDLDFGENVKGGGKIFRGGATMISPSRQRIKIKKYFTFITFIYLCLHLILFLSSLYNCLLKFILLIILLGEVRKFLGEVLKIAGEVQSYPRGGAHLPQNPALLMSSSKEYKEKNWK